jgi:hypothetical protein
MLMSLRTNVIRANFASLNPYFTGAKKLFYNVDRQLAAGVQRIVVLVFEQGQIL